MRIVPLWIGLLLSAGPSFEVLASEGSPSLEPLESLVPLSLDEQIPLLVRVLTYDQKLSQRAPSGVLIVGVLHSGDDEARKKLQKDILQSSLKLPDDLSELSINWVFLDASKPDVLDKSLEDSRLTALYVHSLGPMSVDQVRRFSRDYQVPTIAARRELFDLGLGMVLVSKEGRSRILVNLATTKAEGCDLSSNLLSLSFVETFK